jgi:hypothetical protein
MMAQLINKGTHPLAVSTKGVGLFGALIFMIILNHFPFHFGVSFMAFQIERFKILFTLTLHQTYCREERVVTQLGISTNVEEHVQAVYFVRLFYVDYVLEVVAQLLVTVALAFV